MTSIDTRATSMGLMLAVIFLSGFLLSQAGRPLNSGIFAIHKIIALATVIFLAVTVYRVNQEDGLSAAELSVSMLTGLFFLGTMVTGSLLSFEKTTTDLVLRLHQLLPVLTAVSAATTLYSLLIRK